MDLVRRGSTTAKDGFLNERKIRDKFYNFHNDADAQIWLKALGFDPVKVIALNCTVISRQKSDLHMNITTAEGETPVNISLKKINSNADFNQVDKRWIRNYKLLWNFDDAVEQGLMLFTGESKPIFKTKDERRATLYELPNKFYQAIFRWFSANKSLVITDLLKGRGQYSADWLLVTKLDVKENVTTWALRDMNSVMEYYSEGEVKVSSRGSLLIGRILMQRKGGDGGRDTAKMLQFKMSPGAIFVV